MDPASRRNLVPDTARPHNEHAANARALLKTRRFWAGFLMACVALVAFDHLRDVAQSMVTAATVYQRLVTTGFKPLFPRNTSLVQIRNADEPMEVTLVNVCQQRLFLSRVLDVIWQASPAVVVIDKVFSADACPIQPQGTQALQHAVSDLLSKGIPVVVGIDADANDRLRPGLH